MTHIDLIFFDVTSGHRTAARSIQSALCQRSSAINAQMVNLVDILYGESKLQRLARAGVSAFNWSMCREYPLFQRQQIGFFQALQRHLPRSAQIAVGQFWRDRPTDVVVSLVPICNGFLERSLHTMRPQTPYVVMPADFSEGKAGYWFERDVDAYYLNPASRLLEQARAAGISESRLTSIQGMPVDPAFYDTSAPDRHNTMVRLGFNPEKPVVLVTFGGQGSVLVERCAQSLEQLGSAVNVVFLCGHYEEVRERLLRRDTPYRKCVLGFTPEPPASWYKFADVIVGKPGSMTITEAIVTRKPLVAVRSGTLAVVQRGNEAWLEREGVGRVVEVDDVAQGVRDVLGRSDIRAALDKHWHRGVDEIADHVLRIAGHGETSTITQTDKNLC